MTLFFSLFMYIFTEGVTVLRISFLNIHSKESWMSNIEYDPSGN